MVYRWITFTAFASIIFNIDPGHAAKFPNDIAAVPEIECSPEAIIVRLNTTAGLASKIFVRGHHDEVNCSFQQTNLARFHLQNCGIVRQRQLKPKGLAVSSTFVVQLHPLFITKLDRAYKVRCFYLEADRTITSSLEVSTLSASPIEQETPLPQCQYHLRMDSPGGEEVRYARIGDRVWHVWECDSAASYGMLVHSCNVHDGKGNQIQIIDENGCALDDFIIETPMYNDTVNQALQETLVFKFADVLAVQFHCQIRLCIRANNGCDGITPPNCAGVRNRTLQLVHSDIPAVETVQDETVDMAETVKNETTGEESMDTDASETAGAPSEQSTENGTEAVRLLHDSIVNINDSMEVIRSKGIADEGLLLVGDSVNKLDGNLTTTIAHNVTSLGDNSTAISWDNRTMLDSNSTAVVLTPVEELEGSGSLNTTMAVEQSVIDLMNDTRSRRNVYSESWFTDTPYLDMPSGLETDVSQEILVLDVGDSATSLKGTPDKIRSLDTPGIPIIEQEEEKEPIRLSLMETEERKKEATRRVCVTSHVLAAIISAFVFVIMLLTLTIFLLLIKRHQARAQLTGEYCRSRAYKF